MRRRAGFGLLVLGVSVGMLLGRCERKLGEAQDLADAISIGGTAP